MAPSEVCNLLTAIRRENAGIFFLGSKVGIRKFDVDVGDARLRLTSNIGAYFFFTPFMVKRWDVRKVSSFLEFPF